MKISDAAIADLKLSHPCCDVAAQWVRLRQRGKKYIGPCPLHSADPAARDSTSFECDAEGWVCAVCHDGGDVLRLVALRHGLDPRADFLAVVDLLGGVAEPSPERAAELEQERALRKAQRDKEANEYREKERRRAFEIWHAGAPWRGTAVEQYLREARGIAVLPERLLLRYAPVVAYFDGEETDETGRTRPRVVHRGPAQLAPIVDGGGKFRGVHVTWLDLAQPGGKAVITDPAGGEPLAAKKSYGSVGGYIIPLVDAPATYFGALPRANPTPTPALTGYVGEGIETVLSAWSALSRCGRDLSHAWFCSAVSLGNLAGRAAETVRHPALKDKAKRARRVPGPQPDPADKGFALAQGTSHVVLLGDGDSDSFTTRCALHRGAKRLEAAGIGAAVAMAPDGKDFNDLLRGIGGAVAVDAVIGAAAAIVDPTSLIDRSAAPNLDGESETQNERKAAPVRPAPSPEPDAPAPAGEQINNGGDNVVAFPGKTGRKGKRGKKSAKAAAADGGLDDDDPPREPNPRGYSVDQLNERFALVILGSKPVIYVETPAAPIKDRKRFISLTAFQAWHANRFTEYRDGAGAIRVTTWSESWMRSYKRREFFGVEFSPPDNDGNAVTTPTYLNLWSGFVYVPAEQPDPLRYKIFRDHLINNVCGGNQLLYRWVFGFLAHIVQRPRERIGVALVLRGKMGTGKTKVGEVLGRMIPEHWFLCDDPRYITGNFNVHMATCLLLQADEAVWAGDKTAEGRLKGLITSPRQAIEAKGIDPIWVENYVRLILTSNEDWVVPAGKDERRYAVLDVGDRCAKNTEYFGEMDRELENGGFEHLLGALLRFPLDSVDLRTIPKTEALLEQKIRSLDSVESWWFTRLSAGAPLRRLSEWKTEIPTTELFDDYIAASEKIGVRRKQEETVFGIKLRRLVPGLDTRKVSMLVADEGGRGLKSDRPRCYILPPLAAARSAFEAMVNQAVEWPGGLDDGAADSRERETDVVPL